MMKQNILLVIGLITFLLILWNLFISIRITAYLNKKGIPARIAHRRGYIFRYLNVYRQLTIEESGKTGSLYRWFIISFTLFSMTLLSGIIISAA